MAKDLDFPRTYHERFQDGQTDHLGDIAYQADRSYKGTNSKTSSIRNKTGCSSYSLWTLSNQQTMYYDNRDSSFSKSTGINRWAAFKPRLYSDETHGLRREGEVGNYDIVYLDITAARLGDWLAYNHKAWTPWAFIDDFVWDEAGDYGTIFISLPEFSFRNVFPNTGKKIKYTTYDSYDSELNSGTKEITNDDEDNGSMIIEDVVSCSGSSTINFYIVLEIVDDTDGHVFWFPKADGTKGGLILEGTAEYEEDPQLEFIMDMDLFQAGYSWEVRNDDLNATNGDYSYEIRMFYNGTQVDGVAHLQTSKDGENWYDMSDADLDPNNWSSESGQLPDPPWSPPIEEHVTIEIYDVTRYN